MERAAVKTKNFDFSGVHYQGKFVTERMILLKSEHCEIVLEFLK